MSKTINVRLKLEDYEEKALNIIKGNIITESDSDAVRFAIKKSAKAIVAEMGMAEFAHMTKPIPKPMHFAPELPVVNDETGQIDGPNSTADENDITVEVDPNAEGYKNPLYKVPNGNSQPKNQPK